MSVIILNEDAKSCPKCNADFRGKEIPMEHRSFYPDGLTHYSRIIGVEYPEIYDGIIAWRCPDCRSMFPRFPLSLYESDSRLKEISKRFLDI